MSSGKVSKTGEERKKERKENTKRGGKHKKETMERKSKVLKRA